MKGLRRKRTRPRQLVVLGIDFGTLSARAVAVEGWTGEELGSAEAEYQHGVIERQLPKGKTPLKPGSALQHPGDYLEAMVKCVRSALREAAIEPDEVVGVGTDFTSCTMLPVRADGTPLCFDSKWEKNPHAWVKLWKHHATQAEADAINRLGRQRNEEFIRTYGGRYSSEWFFSKLLETVLEAPEVYRAADKFVEAGDWIVWQLCGQPTRNISAAGFKGMRVQPRGTDWDYPSREFFQELHPDLADVVRTKLAGPILPLGSKAGGLTRFMAEKLNLREGIAVASGNIDAHAGVPACGVSAPGDLVMIMGTSTCHLLLAEEKQEVEGMCGVVQNGVIQGFWGYEAGQPGVGDLFAWYVQHGLLDEKIQKNALQGLFSISPDKVFSLHEQLSFEARKLNPGQSGLLALDWWNGNRSVLVDADLSGVLLGLTLQTQPHEIYRALIEATAFGTRQIIEAFINRGLEVNRIFACGGLATHNELVMQIYADVLQRPIIIPAVLQASAFGAAMYAAVAAGIHTNIQAAIEKMVSPSDSSYKPNRAHAAIYDQLYAEYSRLHDLFGRDPNSVLKNLRRMRTQSARP